MTDEKNTSIAVSASSGRRDHDVSAFGHRAKFNFQTKLSKFSGIALLEEIYAVRIEREAVLVDESFEKIDSLRQLLGTPSRDFVSG
jgi:hypothetical protein